MNIFGIFTRRKERAARPAVALTTAELAAKMADFQGGISPDTAMRVSAVNTCVRILSETVAMLPCKLYRHDNSGGRSEARDHPLYDLLKARPNGVHTAFEFWELLVRQMLLTGNAYAMKTRVGSEIRELIPWSPYAVTPKMADDFSLRYEVRDARGQKRMVGADALVHFREATENGYLGLSRISQAARAISIAAEADRFAENSLRNGAPLKGYLKTDGTLTDDQFARLKADWEAGYASALNAGRTPLLEAGTSFEPVQMSFEDLQFLETRRFQRTDIFGIFRVPPHLAQDYDKSTSWGTGIEQTALQFVIFTALPLLKRLEQKIEAGCLTRRERGTMAVRFQVSALVRGDLKTRAEYYYKGLNAGWLTINDVRRLEDMNPVEGGDANRVPLNTEDITKMIKEGARNAAT